MIMLIFQDTNTVLIILRNLNTAHAHSSVSTHQQFLLLCYQIILDNEDLVKPPKVTGTFYRKICLISFQFLFQVLFQEQDLSGYFSGQAP